MTTRILPPSEWPRLVGTELETVWPILDKATTNVMVVENEGEIVGCWAMFPVTHVEGIWIHPDYRGAFGVSARLLRFMRQLATLAGVKTVMTGCVSSNVADYLERLQASLVPGRQYVIPIVERDATCQP